jgi:hypothetical protein
MLRGGDFDAAAAIVICRSALASSVRCLLLMVGYLQDFLQALSCYEVAILMHLVCHCHLQVGTGVMVGLPGQTLRDLAGDIRFFKQMNANMIGMGPYITGVCCELLSCYCHSWRGMYSWCGVRMAAAHEVGVA